MKTAQADGTFQIGLICVWRDFSLSHVRSMIFGPEKRGAK